MTEVERNKSQVHKITEEIWNRAEFERLSDFYSEEFTSDYAPYAPPRRGLAGVRTMVEGAHKTFTNYREEIIDLLGENDRVMVRLMISGEHTGKFGPIPASGQTLAFQEGAGLTFPDANIVHQRRLG